MQWKRRELLRSTPKERRYRGVVPGHRLVGAVAVFAMLHPAAGGAAPFAYIPCESETWVIDTASDTVVTTIPHILGAGASTVAVAPGGDRVYISSVTSSPDTVIVDTSTHSIIDTLSASGPIALHPTGSLLYVASPFSANVSVVSTATGGVIDTITGFVHPLSLAAHPAGGKLYLADVVAGDIKVIGTATNSIVDTIEASGSAPLYAAVNASGSRTYVGNVAGPLLVIDTATDSIIDTIATGNFPRAVGFHPDGSRIYVSNALDDTLAVVDTATNTVVTTIAVGEAPSGVDVHPDGSKVYVVNGISETVSVIDTATNIELDQIPVGEFCHVESGFIAKSGSSTAATVIVGTGTLTLTTAGSGSLDFDPGPSSVFGTTVEIDAALGGTPMDFSYVYSGAPDFSATSIVLPAFSLSGDWQVASSPGRLLFGVALGPPTGSVLPSGPVYTLVGDLEFPSALPLSGPFVLSATIGANTPAVPGARVPITTTVQLCPGGLAMEVPLTVQFSDVSVAGVTTVTGTCQTPGSIPPNIRIDAGTLAFFFDVTTTASYTAPIRICGSYPDANNDGLVDGLGVSELKLTLLHDEGGNGDFVVANNLDIDAVNNRICGEVDSLSPFLLAVEGVAKGFVPPDTTARTCEHKLLTQSARLLKGTITCNRKAAEAAFKGQTFDAATCEAQARAKYDDKVSGLAGCPACLLANAAAVGDLTENAAEALTIGLYCSGTTMLGGDDFGVVPSDGGAALCAKQQGRNAAKLGKKLGKCYRKSVDAVFNAKTFDLDACLAEENAAFDSAVGALSGCPACATANAAATRNQIERFSLEVLSDVYCAGSTELP